MKCASCGEAVAAGSEYCNNCGAKLEPVSSSVNVVCSCGSAIKEGSKFCSNCGKKVEVERSGSFSADDVKERFGRVLDAMDRIEAAAEDIEGKAQHIDLLVKKAQKKVED